jgi:hypothetical protein
MKQPVKYRWECHHDVGTGQDRERCNCRGNWSISLSSVVAKAKAHNASHKWSGWGYAPMDWENRTVNIMMKRDGARSKDLREGDRVAVWYNEL